MQQSVVRRFLTILCLLLCGAVLSLRAAEQFHLVTGEVLEGDMIAASANDQGVKIKVGEGEYKNVPWGNLSQEDLRKLRSNPKLEPFVAPFIEETPEERVKKTEVPIKQPPRLARPAAKSFFGAMFSSPLGIFLMLLLYAATIYAGFEVALFRAQPVPLVVGLSAIPFLGFFAPIVFISMPTRMQAAAPTWETAAPPEGGEAAHPAPGVTPAGTHPGAPTPTGRTGEALNPMQGEVEHPTTLKLHHDEPAKAELPKPVVFQRGQYTFNRRFIETKFAGFFGMARKESDKDMVLLVKATRGEHAGERITRIAATEMFLQVRRGEATEEVMVPFTEIKEIVLKHKDAP
jgi:hypothetical protein